MIKTLTGMFAIFCLLTIDIASAQKTEKSQKKTANSQSLKKTNIFRDSDCSDACGCMSRCSDGWEACAGECNIPFNCTGTSNCCQALDCY